MKYSFIAQHKNTIPVDVMCQFLGVKRSVYYRFQKKQESQPDNTEHTNMLDWVKKIAKESDCSYGSRRMKRELNALGYMITSDGKDI